MSCQSGEAINKRQKEQIKKSEYWRTKYEQTAENINLTFLAYLIVQQSCQFMDTIFMIELVIIKIDNIFFRVSWSGEVLLVVFQLFSFKFLFKIAFISFKKLKRRSLSVFYYGHYFSKLFRLSFFHLFWKIESQRIFNWNTAWKKDKKSFKFFVLFFFKFKSKMVKEKEKDTI